MTAPSPKQTHEPQREFSIADLHYAGRELVRCGRYSATQKQFFNGKGFSKTGDQSSFEK